MLIIALAVSSTTFAAEFVVSPYLKAGYEDFSWNIAGNTDPTVTPNILSELTWYDLTMEYQGVAIDVLRNHTCIGFSLDFNAGKIISGKVQDSDYNGDNRTGEFSRSISDTGGNRHELSLAAYCNKKQTLLKKLRPTIKSGFGFIISEQRRRLHNGIQIIENSNRLDPSVPIVGLDSDYISTWAGPFLLLDITFQPGRWLYWQSHFRPQLHTYQARAHWNLRTDLADVSFEHKAEGLGYSLGTAMIIKPHPHVGVGLQYQRRYWRTTSGTDIIYFEDIEGNITLGKTRLNGAFWLHHEVSLFLRITL